MADLFLARISGMAGFERLVVVKRLASQLAADPAAMQALFDEARIAATLSHANIVQVNDVEVVDGQVSIVMEFLHGHDVSQLIRRLARESEVLPIDQAVGITLGVCAGLHHAHERMGSDGRPLQIVHRDVSPHNVFVTYDGAVKLIDFGIARAVTRRGKTEQGVIKGKPGYIAPEQLRGFEVDRRTDVWATGVLLYEMTTGVLPFGDSTTLDHLVAVATNDAPPPSSRIENYPRDLEAIVVRALAREPADRYPTTEAMHKDLDGLARTRKVDLSPFRLAALMERVFAPQIAAWRTAQREGKSLADHVAAFRASGAHPAIASSFADIESTLVAPPPAPTSAATPLPQLTPALPPVTAPRATIIAVPPMPAASYAAAVAVDPTETADPLAETVPAPARPAPPPPAARRRWPMIVGAIVALPLILIAGLAFWSLVPGDKHAPVQPAGSASPPPPAPVAAPVAAPATPAPATAPSAEPVAEPGAEPVAEPEIEMPAEPAYEPKHAPKKKPPHHVHHADGAATSPTDPDAPLPR